MPPAIEICIGDGFGGADCIEPAGTKLYRAPTALTNYWMTSEPDEQNFAAWCYGTNAQTMVPFMAKLHAEAKRHDE